MYRLTGCGALLTALLLVFPGSVAGQKKDKKDKKSGVQSGTPAEYAQLRQLSQVSGKLAFADTGSKTLALRIEYQYLELQDTGSGNAGKGKNPKQNLMQQQKAIMRSKNPVQRQQQLRKLVQQAQRMQAGGGKGSLYKISIAAKEFEFEAVDKLIVRRLKLPVEFDDKGFLKTYSKEQITKLRGDNASLPGYAAVLDDLQPGQSVTFYLVASGQKQASPKEEEGVGNVERPKVRMIVIQTEAPEGLSPARPPKKK